MKIEEDYEYLRNINSSNHPIKQQAIAELIRKDKPDIEAFEEHLYNYIAHEKIKLLEGLLIAEKKYGKDMCIKSSFLKIEIRHIKANQTDSKPTKNYLSYEEACRSKDVEYCCLYSEGVYEYKTEKGYILVENNKVLCKDVVYCHWYKEGVYEYQTKEGELIEVGFKNE